MSLVKKAKQDCGIVTASIFVNPKQFAPHEDLARYPRNLERDLSMLEKEGTDIVFAPDNLNGMYSKNYRTYVEVEGMDNITREGVSRPGFFRGVTTVVSKLFNIVQPQKAYFGQKDGIQCIVIKRMTQDLNFPIDIVICPTVREKDGLAMSSRNSYLSPEERKVATTLYQALSSANTLFHSPQRSFQNLLDSAKTVVSNQNAVKLDYLNICDMETGKDLAFATMKGNEVKVSNEKEFPNVMMSGAILVGKTRLIDNILLTS